MHIFSGRVSFVETTCNEGSNIAWKHLAVFWSSKCKNQQFTWIARQCKVPLDGFLRLRLSLYQWLCCGLVDCWAPAALPIRSEASCKPESGRCPSRSRLRVSGRPFPLAPIQLDNSPPQCAGPPPPYPEERRIRPISVLYKQIGRLWFPILFKNELKICNVFIIIYFEKVQLYKYLYEYNKNTFLFILHFT